MESIVDTFIADPINFSENLKPILSKTKVHDRDNVEHINETERIKSQHNEKEKILVSNFFWQISIILYKNIFYRLMICKRACWKRKKHSKKGNHIYLFLKTNAVLKTTTFSRLRKKKEQNIRAKQLAEESGVEGRLAITEKEEKEAEEKMQKLEDVINCDYHGQK
jgi:hypothetical protein